MVTKTEINSNSSDLDDCRAKTIGLYLFNILLVYLLYFADPIVWDYEIQGVEHENKLVKMLAILINYPYITVFFAPECIFVMQFFNIFMLAPIINPCEAFRYFLLPAIVINFIFAVVYMGISLQSAFNMYHITMNILPAVKFYLNSAFITSLHTWFILSAISFYDLLTHMEN